MASCMIDNHILLDFFIPGDFTSLNNYIRAERGHLHQAARIKRKETNLVAFECRNMQQIQQYPVQISFHWVCKDRRTDKDNIRFAAKYVLDGLIQAGVLRDDGWEEIDSFGGDTFEVDKDNPGVEVTIKQVAG